MRQGINRSHVEAGNQPNVRRPLPWEMVKKMKGCTMERGFGGRVVWMGLTLSYLLLLRTSELFTDYRGEFTKNIAGGGEILRFPREDSGKGGQGGGDLQEFQSGSGEEGCDICEDSGPGAS